MNLHKLTLNQSGDRNLGMNDQTMISNVMGCIQNLPSMARSRKEHDLRLKIKLICGYISVLVDQKKNKRNNYLLKKLIKDPYKSSLQGEVFNFQQIFFALCVYLISLYTAFA